jgi:hypothetical protein
VLHQVGVSFDLYYDARKHKVKILEVGFAFAIRHTYQVYTDGSLHAPTYMSVTLKGP